MTDIQKPSESDSAVAGPLLEVRNLVVRYGKKGPAAVDDVSFTIARGETLGLVGESGSGKTTIGRAILGLQPVTSGQILFEGKDITRASVAERRALQGDLRAVFQDPFSSLNPRRPIGDAITEPLRVARVPRAERERRVKDVLARRRTRPRIRGALPAPVLRRPASAHRDRPGAGHRSAPRRLRRGGQRAGSLDAGAGAEPPGGAACRSRARLPLHRARHGGGGVPRSARRRAQPWADHGAGRRRSRCWATRSITTPACSWPHRRFPIPTSRPAGEGVAGAQGRRRTGGVSRSAARRQPADARCVSGRSRRRAARAPAPSRGTSSTIGLSASLRLHSTIVAGSMSGIGMNASSSRR